jgi:hypothetical protein
MLPIVKKKEKERVKKVRAKKVESESLSNQETISHGVLTLNINGSHLEVSARKKDGKLIPYTFKELNDAKKHCKKVGGKTFQSPKTNLYYVEFTKLDGPMSEDEEKEENLKDLKAILDVAKMLSDKSPYFKGRGSKKEYIKMLVHKIKKLSEAKQKKIISTLDAYNKVRKSTMPKSRSMKTKKAYNRKDFKKGRYD